MSVDDCYAHSLASSALAAHLLNKLDWVQNKLKRPIQPVFYPMKCNTDNGEPLELTMRALGILGRACPNFAIRFITTVSLGSRDKPVKLLVGPTMGADVVVSLPGRSGCCFFTVPCRTREHFPAV